MDKDFYQDLQKKSKKKKHHRSRSRSQRKHKRSRSRSQRKKDKKKKQKSYDKQNNRSISEQRKHQAEKSKDVLKEDKNQPQDKNVSKDIPQKQKRKSQRQKDDDSYKNKQKDRESRDRDRKRDKYRQKSDRQYRDRDYKEDSKIRSEKQRSGKGQIKNQERSKSRQRRKDKDRQRQREKDRDRDRPRQREKERQRQRDRNRERQKDRQRDRQRERDRERSRQVQKPSSSRNLQRYESSRRSRTPQRRRQRQQRQRFRFDSPPKSDESDISDDPQKMQKLNRTKAQQQLVTSKADKKLYLGNLPPNITSQQLMDMLNVALKKMQINTDIDGDSIISAWISPDGVGHYAFVQFRTAQQATNGLALNGASLFGYQLKLGRPKQYIEYNKQMLSKFGTDSSIDTILKKVQVIGGQIQLQIKQKIINPPSRIIVLKHIVTVDQLAIDQEYQQIYDDIKDMAKRFGDVIKIVIPRPHQVIDLQQVQKRVKGLGYIFIQYRTIQQAIFARKQFIQKQFSSRSVACSFFNQKRWQQGQYDICQKVIIQF